MKGRGQGLSSGLLEDSKAAPPPYYLSGAGEGYIHRQVQGISFPSWRFKLIGKEERDTGVLICFFWRGHPPAVHPAVGRAQNWISGRLGLHSWLYQSPAVGYWASHLASVRFISS